MATTESFEEPITQMNSLPKVNVDLDKIQMDGIVFASELEPSTSKAAATKELKTKIPETQSDSQKNKIHGPDQSKPLRKKAKILRLERKAAKKSQNSHETDAPSLLNQTTKKHKNEEKTLEMLLNEIPENSLHKFQVKIK